MSGNFQKVIYVLQIASLIFTDNPALHPQETAVLLMGIIFGTNAVRRAISVLGGVLGMDDIIYLVENISDIFQILKWYH